MNLITCKCHILAFFASRLTVLQIHMYLSLELINGKQGDVMLPCNSITVPIKRPADHSKHFATTLLVTEVNHFLEIKETLYYLKFKQFSVNPFPQDGMVVQKVYRQVYSRDNNLQADILSYFWFQTTSVGMSFKIIFFCTHTF